MVLHTGLGVGSAYTQSIAELFIIYLAMGAVEICKNNIKSFDSSSSVEGFNSKDDHGQPNWGIKRYLCSQMAFLQSTNARLYFTCALTDNYDVSCTSDT